MDAIDFNLADFEPPAFVLPAENEEPPAPRTWQLVPPKKSNAVRDREIAFQLLNAIDGIQTVYCLDHVKGCREANPLWGKRPSTEKIIGIKVVSGIIHYLVTDRLRDQGSDWVDEWQWGTIALQGGLVTYNFTVIF